MVIRLAEFINYGRFSYCVNTTPINLSLLLSHWLICNQMVKL